MDLFTLVAKLGMDSSEYERGVSKARGSFSQLASGISAKSVALGNMISNAMEKAVNTAVDLGRSAIQNAADVTAENAQFQATFGQLQGAAEKAFDAIEKETGIFGTRLQKVGTKAFSQFAGAGIKGADGLAAMEEYTKLAADAAAYYDISLEDADARLRSFLRGNTEAGDAIGLFTSESQRNSAAMEKYGAKWKDLNEAQKQMLMLDISKDIYEQSGAIGQASRESDAWTNVIGNFKEAWRQATAAIGAPIIEAITPVIESISKFLKDDDVQLKFKQFGLRIAGIANSTFEGVMEFVDKMLTTGTEENTLLTGISTFVDSIKRVAGLVLDNVMGFLTLLVGGPDGTSDVVTNISTFFTDVGIFIDTYSKPISILIATVTGFFAISNPAALLIAGLVLLVANWNDVKTATINAFNKTAEFFGNVWTDNITPVFEKIWGWISKILSTINEAYESLKKFLGMEADPNFKPPEANPGTATSYGAAGSQYHQGWTSGAVGVGAMASAPGSAGGLFYAKNNYITRLHEGEAVLNSREAAQWRSNLGGDSALAAEIRALRQDLIASRAVMTPDGRVLGEITYETVSQKIATGARSRRYATV